MTGIVADPNGSTLYGATISGRATDAAELGRELADRLLRQGADKILAVAEA
jgi:hydroxymethylbilane synthase